MKSDPPYGTSPSAIIARRKFMAVRAMTGGKCFYCGGPTHHRGDTGGRDWLFPHPAKAKMVREHTTPISRGGLDKRGIFVPSCSGCNRVKASMTLDEFRFVSGLRAGSINFRFAFEEPPATTRDWLVCHSPPFEQALVIHNIPSAADAYELRRQIGGVGGPKPRRIRPVLS